MSLSCAPGRVLGTGNRAVNTTTGLWLPGAGVLVEEADNEQIHVEQNVRQ